MPRAASEERLGVWAAGFVVVATVVMQCLRSHLYPLWMDEVLTFYTVNQPSVGQLIHFQSTTPIVLEPPLFEELAHASGWLFRYGTLSIRAISILSFAVVQVCLYRMLKSVAGVRAGLFAMILVANLPVSAFGYLLRPYGLLMAASVAAFVCWQEVVYGEGRWRRLALVGLAASLAVGITAHFYGVLIVLPVMAAEVARWWRERVVDRGVIAAVVVGLCAVVLDIPFWKATVPFKENMARDAGLGWGTVTQAYVQLLLPFDRFHLWPVDSVRLVGISSVAMVVFFAVLYGSWRRARVVEAGKYLPVWTGLLTLMLVPLPCIFVAYHYTHTFGSRHCCEAALGFVGLAAIAVSGVLERVSGRWVVVGGVVLVGVTGMRFRPHSHGPERRVVRASYAVPVAMQEWLKEHPAGLIYTTPDICLHASLYADPKFFPRMRCLYSQEREIRYTHHQIVYLTDMALQQHTSLPMQFVSYEEFRRGLPAMLVVNEQVPWDAWIAESLTEDGSEMESVGNGLGGQVMYVTGGAYPGTP